VATALAPTLIFTLVLAGIMRERFHVSDAVFGGLLLYAALNTLLPSLVFRMGFDVDPVENERPPHPDDVVDVPQAAAVMEHETASPQPPRPTAA